MFGWHDSPWMWVSMLVFWSLIGIFLYYAFAGRSPGATAPGSGPTAAEILKARYARGEISAEEYRDRAETLAAKGT